MSSSTNSDRNSILKNEVNYNKTMHTLMLALTVHKVLTSLMNGASIFSNPYLSKIGHSTVAINCIAR